MKRLFFSVLGTMEDGTRCFVTVRGHPCRVKRLALVRFGESMEDETPCFVTVRGTDDGRDTLLCYGSGSSVEDETPCFVGVLGDPWKMKSFLLCFGSGGQPRMGCLVLLRFREIRGE